MRHANPGPVHVIGHPRSGTSLFVRLLRKYLQIAFGTESQFILRYHRRLGRYGDLQIDRNLRRLVEHLCEERWFVRCRQRFGFETTADAILADVRERSLRGVLTALFLQLQKHFGMQRWGDKTPEYVCELPVLHGLFPDAKYIHVVRDGRDVALSGFEQHFGEQNVYMAAREWASAVEKAAEFGRGLPAGQFLEVRYEDFLSQPVAEFARLIEFLDIDDAGGALLAHIETHVAPDLMHNNFNKWKQKLSPRQIKRFDRQAAGCLRAYGYECTAGVAPPPGLLHSVYWRCDNQLRKLLRADYWRDNFYKVGVRGREAVR